MKKQLLGAIALLATSSSLVAAHAEGTNAIKKFLIEDATPSISVRYRYENIDQDKYTKDARASTLRTKLGYKTGTLYDTQAIIELENVTYLGSDRFNSTTNGNTSYPTVADPDSTEINHAYLSYTGIADTTINIGRQPHNLDNQRFVGTVGWRQNDQSYDAAMLANTSIDDTTLIYSYVNNVNRINGDDHPLGNLDTHTHVFNASYDGLSFGKITGYGYLIDLNDSPVFGLSSKTFGLRFTGDSDVSEGVKALYTLEYAQQTDYADNPTNYTAQYYTIEAGVDFKGVTAKIGYEVLGSDNGGTVAFQTPLATGHKFNGWADKFLTTPGTGLEDFYANISYKLKCESMLDGLKFHVAYHDYSSDTGGLDYGNEWNASIAKKFKENYGVKLVYANYDADTFSSDTQKYVVQLTADF